MRRELAFCLGLIVLIVLGINVSSLAQENPVVIERLEISLWPEYDTPRLLVIYRGELAEMPVGPLVFSIPPAAQVHAAAHRSADDRLLANQWLILPGEGGQQEVAFTPGSQQFQFEYYQDLTRTGSKKSFVFRFRSRRYEVKELSIEVQQPLSASGFEPSPALEPQGQDNLGLSYFKRKIGAVAANAPVEQRVSYVKTDDEPSVKPQLASAGESSRFPWQLVVGVSLLVLSLGGLTWFWLRRRSIAAAPKTSTPRRRGSEKMADAPRRTEAKFCEDCGHEFQSGERFCPDCGSARS